MLLLEQLHINRGVFPFNIIWSLYPAISGQAIPSAFGRFSLAETAKNLKVSDDSDFEVKIRSLMYDLSNFSVYEHPYTCALLYRTLLEISTRLVYDRHVSSISNPYNEKDLVGNMKYLVNNFLFKAKSGKDIPKLKGAIKVNLSNLDIIHILNLYIHYPNPVDEQILLSTWNSMKFYIQACLEN